MGTTFATVEHTAHLAAALINWGLSQKISMDQMIRKLSLAQSKDLYEEGCRLSAYDYSQLIDYLSLETGHSDLGFVIGSELNISTYGLLGHALISLETAGQAVEYCLKYAELTSSFTSLDAQYHENEIIILVSNNYELPSIDQFIQEELIVGAMSIMRSVVGELFFAKRIYLTFAKPAHSEALESFLRCPVTYNAAVCTIVVDQQMLSLPIKTGNPITASYLTKLCDELLDQLTEQDSAHDDDIITLVRKIIIQSPPHWPTINEVASTLNCSERTLRRRLIRAGTQYQSEMDHIRQKIVQKLMLDTKLNIEDIALYLGYSEASSFRKAFHRWFDCTPQAYRQQVAH